MLGPDEVPKSGEDIRRLKYLHHAINETLRYWESAMSSLVRIATDLGGARAYCD